MKRGCLGQLRFYFIFCLFFCCFCAVIYRILSFKILQISFFFFPLQMNKMNVARLLFFLTMFVCVCGSTARPPWRPTTWSTPKAASWTWTTYWLTWWRTETRWDILSRSFPGFIFTSCLAGKLTGATECPISERFVKSRAVCWYCCCSSRPPHTEYRIVMIVKNKYREFSPLSMFPRTQEMFSPC